MTALIQIGSFAGTIGGAGTFCPLTIAVQFLQSPLTPGPLDTSPSGLGLRGAQIAKSKSNGETELFRP